MKICHITSAHGEEDVRIFWKECMSLAEKHEVYLVERGESYEKNGVKVVGIGNPDGGRLRRIFSFSKKAYNRALSIDADLYHLHDPELLLYALKLKRKGKKVIFDSHEFYVEQIKNKNYLKKNVANVIAFLYKLFQTYVFRRIDAVIIPCTLEGKNPFEHIAKRVEIISNFVRIEEFDIEDEAKEKAKADEFKACYIGGLTEERGITSVVKACDKAGVKLILAGDFSSTEYENSVVNMPEYSCVEYRGYLDRNGIRNVLEESNIGFFTLRDVGQYFKLDAFGVKVYEYMINFLPVIMSNSAYNERMNNIFEFGICVNPDDINEIAKTVSYLKGNTSLCEKMGKNGHNAVISKLNWATEEKKLFSLYDDVLFQ